MISESRAEKIIYNYNQLLPTFFISGFVVAIFIIVILFFPEKNLKYHLLKPMKAEPIAAYYLEKLVALYPQDHPLKLALIEQQIELHQWQRASANINELAKNPQWINDVNYLRFILAYYQAYQLPKNNTRDFSFKQLRIDIKKLYLQQQLTNNQILTLAKSALSLELPGLALRYYERLGSIENIILLKQIAATALQTSQYAISAQYYMLAMSYEKDLELKRNDVVSALSALQAGGLFAQGITLINTLPEKLIQNKVMLIYLSNFMLKANRPDLAEIYIKKALLLR